MLDQSRRRTAKPPYISFTSFICDVQNIVGAADELVLPKGSSSASALRTALVYLDLLDPSGRPTEVLRNFCSAEEDERRTLLRRVLIEHYPCCSEQGVSETHAEEAMRHYKIGEASRAKAVRFILRAAQYAGIPVLRRQKRSASDAINVPVHVPNGTYDQEITLECGGEIRIWHHHKLYELTPKDAELVTGLINLVQRYRSR